MKLSIVDTHAHLDMEPFNEDRTEVIARALDSGVSTIITVGINLESSKKAVELAENYAEVLATVGFHPHEANGVKAEDIANLAKIADHPRVLAIGEIGLDFYRNYSLREAQLQVLKWQLELAVKLDLPVIIHCRQAEEDMLPLLHDWTSCHKEPHGQPRGVIHCFSGDVDTAQRYLDMGFFVSFGAYIGYPSPRYMPNVIRSIPQDRLVVETDSPFLPPQSHRGQRNEPAYLPLTVALLAEIREVSPETVAKETTQNARRLFRMAQETA
ncbi:TatD family hydrolase [Chloroflexota bacterium]